MSTILGITSFGAITALAYFVGWMWKTSDKLPDKWIPGVCGGVGIILGIVAYLIHIPEFPATDIITAAAIGLVSGWAATGANQMKKQLTKDDE